MKARTLQRVVIVALIAGLGGCITATGPVPGEDLCRGPELQGRPECRSGGGGLAAIGPLFGATGLIAGLATGVLAAWRKIKPSPGRGQDEGCAVLAATAATVTGIEEFKKASPDSWEKLGELIDAQLTKQGLDPQDDRERDPGDSRPAAKPDGDGPAQSSAWILLSSIGFRGGRGRVLRQAERPGDPDGSSE